MPELRQLAGSTLSQYDLRLAGLSLLARHEYAVFQIEASKEHEARAERFALRLYDPDALKHPSVTTELEWLTALRQDVGLGVPRPVPNRGETC